MSTETVVLIIVPTVLLVVSIGATAVNLYRKNTKRKKKIIEALRDKQNELFVNRNQENFLTQNYTPRQPLQDIRTETDPDRITEFYKKKIGIAESKKINVSPQPLSADDVKKYASTNTTVAKTINYRAPLPAGKLPSQQFTATDGAKQYVQHGFDASGKIAGSSAAAVYDILPTITYDVSDNKLQNIKIAQKSGTSVDFQHVFNLTNGDLLENVLEQLANDKHTLSGGEVDFNLKDAQNNNLCVTDLKKVPNTNIFTAKPSGGNSEDRIYFSPSNSNVQHRIIKYDHTETVANKSPCSFPMATKKITLTNSTKASSSNKASEIYLQRQIAEHNIYNNTGKRTDWYFREKNIQPPTTTNQSFSLTGSADKTVVQNLSHDLASLKRSNSKKLNKMLKDLFFPYQATLLTRSSSPAKTFLVVTDERQSKKGNMKNTLIAVMNLTDDVSFTFTRSTIDPYCISSGSKKANAILTQEDLLFIVDKVGKQSTKSSDIKTLHLPDGKYPDKCAISNIYQKNGKATSIIQDRKGTLYMYTGGAMEDLLENFQTRRNQDFRMLKKKKKKDILNKTMVINNAKEIQK